MKFPALFASRKAAKRPAVPVLRFVGEQDGPRERMLKGKLSELFARRKNISMAYLAMGHRGDPKNISMCLCLGTASGTHERLSEDAHYLFAQYFNRTVNFNVVFLKSEQEVQLALVCKPFYQSN
jgi:SseB protein C-terminal domain